jgi:hypothetical protein
MFSSIAASDIGCHPRIITAQTPPPICRQPQRPFRRPTEAQAEAEGRNRRIGGRVNVQIKQIRSDIVELLFNPHEEDLRVGENLTLREKGSDRGLIVQIIEFRTITYPSLLHEMMEMLAEETETTEMPDLPEVQAEDGLSEMSNLKLAIAKIRKVVQWTPQTLETELERPRA